MESVAGTGGAEVWLVRRGDSRFDAVYPCARLAGLVRVGDSVRLCGEVVDGGSPGSIMCAGRALGEKVCDVVLPTEIAVVALSAAGRVGERSLQSVWDARCLAPEWVGARVVELMEGGVRLQDASTGDQPSVVWRLDKRLAPFSKMLCVGDDVVLSTPVVVPTGDSFELQMGPTTVVYTLPQGGTQRAGNEAAGTSGEPRLAKRPRLEPTLAESKQPITMHHASRLCHPAEQGEFGILTTVLKPPFRESPIVTLLWCEEDTCIRIAGRGMADVAAACLPGHTVWIERLSWAEQLQQSAQTTGGSSHGGWVAGRVVNISTMPGVLYSPFVRTIVPVASLSTRASKRDLPFTVQVCVRIERVSLASKDKEVTMTVLDHSLSTNRGLSTPLGNADPRRNAAQRLVATSESTKDEPGKPVTVDIVARDAMIERLFYITAGEFWSRLSDDDREARIGEVETSAMLMSVTVAKQKGSLKTTLVLCAAARTP